MNTSQNTTSLSKPINDDPIPTGTLGYFRTRNKRRAYSLVMNEFEKSGVSQATLARRLRKKPEVVCRLLSGPGNWGLDTHSDLMFAIRGGVPTYGVDYPLDKPPRNFGPREQYDFKVYTGSTQDGAPIIGTNGEVHLRVIH
jgi:hypothetical protein